MALIDFDHAFTQLTGNRPFPWQQELYRRFESNQIPAACTIPTGLGKTNVIAVWLIALANYPDKMPRRLVYVVNRRTVVDQTTDEVEKLRGNLGRAGLLEPLRDLCALPLLDDQQPLAISTLRGQFADNREWSADPARPAVICGTVDMIGSRLLFNGYRVGYKGKPLHAGFLGQDALLVHDEAHLEPAFQTLIECIQDEQRDREHVGQLPWRKLDVMALTATARATDAARDRTLELTPEETILPAPVPEKLTEPVHHAWRRLHAKKHLHLVAVVDEKKELAEKIATLALEERFKNSGRTIVIFVQAVNDVQKIMDRLAKAKQAREQLTGTMRGLERDRLRENPVFARFLPGADKAQGETPTAYLVCTSAGEVGVNISADHLICDLTTFESMAQRLGRVNRFGDRSDTEIHVFHPKEFEKDEYDLRRQRTLSLLHELKGDASPASLARLDADARQQAFAPPPTVLPVTDIVLDAWALTTIRGDLPGRPPIEPYLHGLTGDWQPPETYVAWREEVELITGELLSQHSPEELLEDYPLKPQELLRDRSDRVFKELQKIADRHPDAPVWLVDDFGGVDPEWTLKKLSDKENRELINYRTVLLPPMVGGLSDKGMLDGSVETRAEDVADVWYVDKEKTTPRRLRQREEQPRPEPPPDMRLVREINLKPNDEELEEVASEEETAEAEQNGLYWRWYVRPWSADDDSSKSSREAEPVSWAKHTLLVAHYAKRIAAKLNLPPEMQRAVELAAQAHDFGKRRELWQQSIGNPNPTEWYAKGARNWKPIDVSTYRHEFGSLVDVVCKGELRQLTHEMADLVIHLIASHHGRGRPHFPEEEVFDPEPKGQDVNAIASEVPRRFARLQRKYGRWGLAYLESLLRAADYAASANPSAPLEESR